MACAARKLQLRASCTSTNVNVLLSASVSALQPPAFSQYTTRSTLPTLNWYACYLQLVRVHTVQGLKPEIACLILLV